MNYIVVEIQRTEAGGIATLVDSYADYNTAAQKYHTILAAAAVSSLPQHGAVLMDYTGATIERHTFDRGTE